MAIRAILVELEPKYTNAYFYRGNYFLRGGKYESAINDYSQTVKLNPEFARAYINRAKSYADLDDWDNSINRNLVEAEKMALKAVEHEKDNPYFVGTLGWVYFKQKKYKKAEAQLKKAISLFTEDDAISKANDIDHLGDVYKAIGNINAAREHWKKALNLTQDEELQKELEIKLKKAIP